ncbi:hypothetical protein ACIBCT_22735 [Streptosporangium sp. NPDC050855]|uniref:hypothetical protein n=1 Tax=Streptosporangium sp. NPDC050855 TaxID=3366194 RepID=UPI00379251B6
MWVVHEAGADELRLGSGVGAGWMEWPSRSEATVRISKTDKDGRGESIAVVPALLAEQGVDSVDVTSLVGIGTVT